MPIYEYRRADGTTFEVQQSFSDDALTSDPETGEPVTRVFHPPAVHFKGKGFYNTDYGTRSRQREAAAEKADGAEKPAAAEKSDGGKTEAAKPQANGSGPAKPSDKPVAAGS